MPGPVDRVPFRVPKPASQDQQESQQPPENPTIPQKWLGVHTTGTFSRTTVELAIRWMKELNDRWFPHCKYWLLIAIQRIPTIAALWNALMAQKLAW